MRDSKTKKAFYERKKEIAVSKQNSKYRGAKQRRMVQLVSVVHWLHVGFRLQGQQLKSRGGFSLFHFQSHCCQRRLDQRGTISPSFENPTPLSFKLCSYTESQVKLELSSITYSQLLGESKSSRSLRTIPKRLSGRLENNSTPLSGIENSHSLMISVNLQINS